MVFNANARRLKEIVKGQSKEAKASDEAYSEEIIAPRSPAEVRKSKVVL